jgi:hypothetical protein
MTTMLLASVGAYAADAKLPVTLDATAAFSRLKSLAGEWEAKSNMGKLHLSYTLIAGGTAIVERESSDQMPEMLTVYYMDGKRLLLTHFCMAGNQPRMEAQSYDTATGELQFRLLDVTNLASPAAGHMRSATLRLVDDQHLKADWSFYENGSLKTTESAQYRRVR